MTLRVYNTLTKTEELFTPVHPGKVGMYLCGPTVYKPPHVGHMVGPVIFDAIKRYLQFKGYEVTWIVNVTDVDDKIIEAAARLNTTVQELAERCTAAYLECLQLLGVDSIDRFPKASEHVTEIIDMCRSLVDSGKAYAADGNVWFDVSKDSDYGKLSHRDVKDQESGTRNLEGSGKRQAADFALWKSAKPGEPAWDSPWGGGRPGWHIECSAMSMKYLGNSFDIHGGGLDLLFPHHENELAQSESFSGKPFVKYWLHNGLTKVRTKSAAGQWQTVDMHASTGNAISAKEQIERHGPELFRYVLLSTHYRSPIDFSDEVWVMAAKGMATFSRLTERIERLTGYAIDPSQPDLDGIAGRLSETPAATMVGEIVALKMKFLETMDADFNTGGAIGALHEMAGRINSYLEQNKADATPKPEVVEAAVAAYATLRKLGRVLGLFRPIVKKESAQDIAKLMALFLEMRNEARAKKDFALADRIRDGLQKAGYVLEDRAGGTGWRKM